MTMRVTQNLVVQRSIAGIQTSAGRVSTLQDQLSSGKKLTRPSDSPTDTALAMRLRASLAANDQYARNASDGIGRLAQTDQALSTTSDLVAHARDLAVQGANSGAMPQSSRDALAAELDQVKASLLDQANTTYLSRPVFGGLTAGSTAYAADGTYTGDDGVITRKVGDTARVQANVDGRAVYGSGSTSVFAEIDDLSNALRSGDTAGITTGMNALKARLDTVSSAQTTVGVAYQRLQAAQTGLTDQKLTLKSSLTDVEDIDVASTMIDLNLQEVAYQTALASAARTVQTSLTDFLR